MKISKNFFLAYLNKNIVVDITENKNGAEIFPAKDVTVEEFDTLDEANDFVKSNKLVNATSE